MNIFYKGVETNKGDMNVEWCNMAIGVISRSKIKFNL